MISRAIGRAVGDRRAHAPATRGATVTVGFSNHAPHELSPNASRLREDARQRKSLGRILGYTLGAPSLAPGRVAAPLAPQNALVRRPPSQVLFYALRQHLSVRYSIR